MYDVMKYDKSNKFDKWIENIYKGLPRSNLLKNLILEIGFFLFSKTTNK